MNRKIRILLIEDNPDDAELVLRELRKAGYEVDHLRVQTAPDMRAALVAREWDALVSDFSMPTFDAHRALRVAQEARLDVPFIVVSGTIGEETAVEVLKAGAHDFIVKDRLARFIPALERELRDATVRRERRMAEQALRTSETRFRRFVETAREGIWHVDAAGNTAYMNQRMAEMLGTGTESVIGAPIALLVDSDITAFFADSTAPDTCEFLVRRRDETSFWGSFSVSRGVSVGNSEEGCLAMVTDVTERRRMQEQLMVGDRMASIGILAAGVAHEINNPLAAVVANLDLAVESLDEPELDKVEHRALLADAIEAAERVRVIVKDLKVFSRSEDEVIDTIDVRRAVESALRMAWNEVRHRARLVTEYEPTPPVTGNDARLGQVVLNIVVNAAQSIPLGSAEDNVIRVRCGTASDGRAFVEVADTGAGMSRDTIAKLFTPFYTTKPAGVGTGLGLSICHRIVAAMGGEIAVESNVVGGSTFRVFLPAAVGVAVRRRVSSVPSPDGTDGELRGRLLVVDDDTSVARVIGRALASHDVVITTSVKEAFAQLEANSHFDVILCDLVMPDSTGMDLYQRIATDWPRLLPRIMFMSGGAFTASARAFLADVPNERIEKPFTPETLRARVMRRLDKLDTLRPPKVDRVE